MPRLASLLLSLCLAPSTAAAHEVSVADLTIAAEAAHAQIDLIETQQRTGFTLIGRVETERAFEEAVFDAMSGRHEDAAMGFLALAGLVDDPSLRRECAWYLAENLYAAGHIVLAEDALREVLDDGQSPFTPDAAALLLRLYAEQRDPTLFAPVYEDLQRRGFVNDDNTLRYTVGRSWFLVGRYAEARVALDAVESTSPSRLRADYVLAALDVAENHLDQARARLEGVANASVDDAVAREIVDRARLGVARIDLERGDYWSAAEQYTMIGGDSPVLDEALLELVWTHIQRNDGEAALNAIDLFLMAFGDHQEAGRLEIVRGHLLMKQGRWGDASLVYSAVDERSLAWEATWRTLDIASLRKGAELAGTAALPDWLWARFRHSPLVFRATAVEKDLATVPDDLDRADADAATLAKVLTDATTLQRHRRVRSSTFVALGLVVDRLHDLVAKFVTRDAQGHRASRREIGTRLAELQLRADALDQSDALRSGRPAVEPVLKVLINDTEFLLTETMPEEVKTTHTDVDQVRIRLMEAVTRGEHILERVRHEEELVAGPLGKQITELQSELVSSRTESNRLAGRAEDMWAAAAAEGHQAVLAQIDTSIYESRAGLADASWSRMQEIVDQKEALLDERNEGLARLEELFRTIRARQ